MKLISKSNFHLICRLIKPQNVISLILCNDEPKSDQINFFVSLVRLRQFTRLRSLTLLNIDEDQLNLILKQIKLNLLTSFSFSIRKYDNRRIKTTNNLLASTLTQPTLRQLEFYITPIRMAKFSWPLNCPVQYLTINNNISINTILTILQCSPHLHTIIIKDTYNMFGYHSFPTSFPRISFRQLTSLTIENLDVTIDQLEPFLSLTPSLVYLKLIGGKHMLDGKRWEQFMEINLPELDKFEFFFDEDFTVRKTLADLELIIASFQTPFWTAHKRWFVICEYKDDYYSTNIHLYSIPICKSFLEYEPQFRKVSLSSFPMATENESKIMNNVKSLALVLDKAIANDIHKKVCCLTKAISYGRESDTLFLWNTAFIEFN
jgi:hypothetical protein